MNKDILANLTIPMTKQHQELIVKWFNEAVSDNGSGAIICQARVKAPGLGAVWLHDPSWQLAAISPRLYRKIQSLLVEAHTGKKP